MLKSIKASIYRRKNMMFEFPLRGIEDRKAKYRLEQNIPPIVYQTWLTKSFGKTHAMGLNKFRDLNPGLDFKILDEPQINAYMKSSWGDHDIYQIFTNAQFGPMRTDIFRYCVLRDKGGYYFDINKCLTVPISSLHPRDSSAIISFEKNDCAVPPDASAMDLLQYPGKYILQWGLGFSKGHPILTSMIENICKYYPYFKNKEFENPKHAILSFTGPGMYTKTVREFMGQHGADGIAQIGIDFNSSGISSMKGSKARYLVAKPYAEYKNRIIVS